MYESLLKYIKSHSKTPLTEGEIDTIKNIVVPKKLRKGQYFLQEGEVCKYLGFIVSGAMRQYSVDDKGAEHIVRLTVENWWAGDRESHINLTPSAYNIDAWEDSNLLQFTRADQLLYLNAIPAINEMSLKLDENFAIAAQKRFNTQISMTAENRYSEFSKSFPEFVQRFPQHIIASYLGITKETLSRIRRNTSIK
jgi:CRP-like cAMP-binding protein